jgi:predicted Rossmann fold flavoprotein
MDYDIVIIGGGPAGLMAGGRAAKAGAKVLILEKNEIPGKKLSITGGGRCNITNAEYDTRALLAHYGDAAKFLHSPFAQFSVQDTFTFFEKHKLPLVVEARKRAFPKSQKAQDVVDTMVRFAESNGAELQTKVDVKRFFLEGDKVTAIETSMGKVHAKRFIIATGGAAGKTTTGDGFSILKDIGHTIHRPNPNLVPLKSDAPWVHRLSGIAPSFMTVRFKQDGIVHLTKTGKMLFTHFGLSGPLILNSSYEVSKLLRYGPVVAAIDLFPDTDHAMLDKRLLKLFDANKNKQLKNVFTDMLEEKLALEIIKLCGLTFETPVHSVSKEERKKLVHTLKDLVVPISDTMGMDRAVVADGGVDLTEVDFKTMSSKLHPNVYIIGDLLNINRPTGGYSLQLCWTMGHVAGNAAAAGLGA